MADSNSYASKKSSQLSTEKSALLGAMEKGETSYAQVVLGALLVLVLIVLVLGWGSPLGDITYEAISVSSVAGWKYQGIANVMVALVPQVFLMILAVALAGFLYVAHPNYIGRVALGLFLVLSLALVGYRTFDVENLNVFFWALFVLYLLAGGVAAYLAVRAFRKSQGALIAAMMSAAAVLFFLMSAGTAVVASDCITGAAATAIANSVKGDAPVAPHS